MKSLKIVLLTALTFIFINTIFAQVDQPIRTQVMIANVSFSNDNQYVDIRLTQLSDAMTEVSISSLNGRTYYKEIIKGKSGYYKWFNLENLKPGAYELVITQPGIKHHTMIQLTSTMIKETGTLSFFNNESSTY